jgi:hypothetical protein
MVCLESAMTCPGMSGYLNSRFDRAPLKVLSSTKITPLIVIDVENFEDILPEIKKYGFDELLDSYYRFHFRGGQDQLVPFRLGNIPLLGDERNSDDEREFAFRQFFDDMGVRVFGENLPDPAKT